MTALLALLVLPIQAQDIRAWQGMYEGRLIEAADGDLEQAIERYQGLLGALAEGDPTRNALQYWLGRALYSQGDLRSARNALEFASEDPQVGSLSRSLLGRIDEEEQRIHTLPIHDDFLNGTGHWVRSWRHASKGDLSTRNAPGGDLALAWSTQGVEREDDQILLSFQPETAVPRNFRLSMRSESFPAPVLPVIYDTLGHRFTLNDPIEIPREGWASIELARSDFTVGEGVPKGVATLILQDVTAYYSTDRGPNTLFLGDVVVE